MAALPTLNSFDLLACSLGDDDLQRLTVVESLRWLGLHSTKVTDAGLAKFNAA